MRVNILTIPEYTRNLIIQHWKNDGWQELIKAGDAWVLNEKFHYIFLPGEWFDTLCKVDGANIEQIKIDLFSSIVGNRFE